MSFNGLYMLRSGRLHIIILFITFTVFSECAKEHADISPAARRIRLSGPISSNKSEISGLAWHRDYLILMPQYPSGFYDNKQIVFYLKKQDIYNAIATKNHSPLKPLEFALIAPDMYRLVPGFEGFEAVTFYNTTVYLTIEARPEAMKSYIISGKIDPLRKTITLNTESLMPAKIPVNIPNATYESLFVAGNRIIAIFEANGRNINPHPRAMVFTGSLTPAGDIPFPAIEYRITDTTELDNNNRFWAVNYFWPGEEQDYRPAPDTLPGAQKPAALTTHIERLICLQYSRKGITITEIPPLYFTLPQSDTPHNWEGIARLDDLGLLIVTDMYPETVLAFVPYK